MRTLCQDHILITQRLGTSIDRHGQQFFIDRLFAFACCNMTNDMLFFPDRFLNQKKFLALLKTIKASLLN